MIIFFTKNGLIRVYSKESNKISVHFLFLGLISIAVHRPG